ncbi:MAG: M56 family metallopeptidase [Gemmatimonadota bacterium]|nr:M56 family metallopeptidase [Gemmatimonadota bacterium]
MALFMAYTALVTALVLAVCHFAEKCLMALQRPTRFVWLIAVCVAVGFPAAGILNRAPRVAGVTHPPTGEFAVLMEGALSAEAVSSARLPRLLESLTVATKRLDRILMWLWVGGSVLSLLCLSVIGIRTRRIVALADTSVMAGVPVRVTDNVGPALVGIFHYDIVVPRWALGLSAERQALIVAHERQHSKAFDPVLVCVAAVAVMLMPWNVVLWNLARRLRASIEVDCDARVLESMSDVHTYASLLIDVGTRVAPRPFMAAALSESASQLHRRIRAMAATAQAPNKFRAIAWAAVACVVLGAALRTPQPETPMASLLSDSSIGRTRGSGTSRNGTPIAESALPNIATVLVQSRSRLPVSVLVYATRAARVARGEVARPIGSDTLKLDTPARFTADLTSGEVHVVSADGSDLEVTALFRDSPAIDASARWPHVILRQGGTGVGSPLTTRGNSPAPAAQMARDSVPLYFEYQVSEPVTLVGGLTPVYPPALKASKVEGQAVLQFIVDIGGRVETGSARVLRSSHAEFSQAAVQALGGALFAPARLNDRPVRQIVQQAFVFKPTR